MNIEIKKLPMAEMFDMQLPRQQLLKMQAIVLY